MRLLKIVYLLQFLVLAMFINAEQNIDMKFMQKDIAENDEVPRVKIKVFRSPSKEHNGKEFTTWGFWIRQPAEIDRSH